MKASLEESESCERSIIVSPAETDHIKQPTATVAMGEPAIYRNPRENVSVVN